MDATTPPQSPSPGGFTIISVKITLEIEQLQFIPSFEIDWEIEQRRWGERLACRETAWWQQEQALKLALKRARTYEEYERLVGELADIHQAMTDLQNELENPPESF